MRIFWALILLAAAPVSGQHAEPKGEEHGQEQHGEQEHEEHFHRNEVVLLLGVTHEAEGGDNFSP